jgi:sec-independent protein translocase protein TatA
MFDPSAPHIIILLIVVLLLFGSRRLPGAARALGESMNIFKKSVHGLDDSGKPMDATTTGQATTAQGPYQQPTLPAVAPQQLSTPAQPFDAVAHQQQLTDLQRQIEELKQQNGGTGSAAANGPGAPLPEAQHSQQPF